MGTDRKRILIAEDDTEMLHLLELELSQRGYDILTAASGARALAAAQEKRPDLILLDVMLPDIDGYHVARQLSETMGADVPKIMIMTSRNIEREKGLALMSGAASAIQKPLDMERLHGEIAAILDDD